MYTVNDESNKKHVLHLSTLLHIHCCSEMPFSAITSVDENTKRFTAATKRPADWAFICLQSEIALCFNIAMYAVPLHPYVLGAYVFINVLRGPLSALNTL